MKCTEDTLKGNKNTFTGDNSVIKLYVTSKKESVALKESVFLKEQILNIQSRPHLRRGFAYRKPQKWSLLYKKAENQPVYTLQ